MTWQGLYLAALSTCYAFKELIIWMVKLNRHVNDSGSRQMEIQNSGDLQMEGMMAEVEVEVLYLLGGSL